MGTNPWETETLGENLSEGAVEKRERELSRGGRERWGGGREGKSGGSVHSQLLAQGGNGEEAFSQSPQPCSHSYLWQPTL